MLHDLLAPYEDHLTHCYVAGASCVARLLGQTDTLLGHHDEAEAHFAVSVEIHGRVGEDHYTAYTELDWAQMLLARGRDGDVDRARSLVDDALSVARRRGYPVAERRADELLSSAGR